MKVKEESEKVGLKLNIQKTKIMASGPITSWQIDGETVETERLSSYKSWIYFVRFIPKNFILGVANVSSIVFLTLNFTYSLLSEMKVTQPCPTLCDSMDYIVHEILQARILEWVAFPFFRGCSQLRDPAQVSHIAGDSLPGEPQGKPKNTGVDSLPFSRGSFQPRDRTGVSCIAGRFFTNWAIREDLVLLA